MSNLFLGALVVAITGNAVEHSTAILVAPENRIELSPGIAIGSTQVALFIAQVLVLPGFAIAPRPWTSFSVLQR